MITIAYDNRLVLWKVVLCLAMVGSLLDVVCRGEDYPCGHSTVDDGYGPAYSSEAKSFLSKLQDITKTDDRTQFAKVVQYPLRVNGDRMSQISTPEELMRRYQRIVTPSVKQAIIAQSANCLFANDQGVMIGRGQVWFGEDASGEMKVISIN